MNGKIAKKMRKIGRRNWIEYEMAILSWSYMTRLRFAWHFINPIKELKKIKRLNKWRKQN